MKLPLTNIATWGLMETKVYNIDNVKYIVALGETKLWKTIKKD